MVLLKEKGLLTPKEYLRSFSLLQNPETKGKTGLALNHLDIEVLDETSFKKELENTMVFSSHGKFGIDKPMFKEEPKQEKYLDFWKLKPDLPPVPPKKPEKKLQKQRQEQPQDSKKIKGKYSTLFENIMPSLSDADKDELFQAEKYSLEKQLEELSRIRKQAHELEVEYAKELKFKEASMHLISLYSSPRPISAASSASKGSSEFGKGALSPVVSLPLDSHLPALIDSSKAFVESSSSLIAISSALQEVYQREKQIIAKVAVISLKELTDYNAELQRALNELEFDNKTVTAELENIKKSDTRNEVVQILCEELVKLKYFK